MTTELPLLPRPGGTADPEALRRLRRFHLDPPAEPGEATAGVLPALLAPYRDGSKVRTGDPFFTADAPESGGPALALPELLSRLAPAAGEAKVLAENLPRLERRLRRLAADLSAPAEARALLAAAGEGLADELALPAAEAERLTAELEKLLAALPAGGLFVPFGADAPLHLLAAAARGRLAAAREAFAAEVREGAAYLAGLVEADRRRGEEGRGAGALGAGMGRLGTQLVDPAALAGVVGKRRGGGGLDPERRRRFEQALEALEAFAAGTTSLVLVHDGSRPAPEGAPGLRAVAAEDPCAAAAEEFDREAGRIAEALKALRVARLEERGNYDPERHQPWLDRLDWRSFTAGELALLPPVAARMGAGAAAGEGLLSLTRLLLSGRPVQVLLEVDPAENPGAAAGDPLSGFRFEPGYLGLSHREVLVCQSSAARPEHLAEGFGRALAATRGALHVVAVPALGDGEAAGDEKGAGDDPAAERAAAWLTLGAALEGRAHPLFRYDPQAGATWARRLDFSGNPAPGEDWPVDDLACRAEAGGEQTLSLPFTFADYALLSPAHRRHFLAVPDGVPESELISLARWLEADEETHTLPFVWGVDARGRLLRLAVSRPLALACRDRLDFWRTLQELAGVKSEYVREAVEGARLEAEEGLAAERERLEAEHAAELVRVRRQAAEEVTARLTAALLEVDVAAFAAPAPGFGDGFAGQSVDEVSQALLKLVDPASLEGGPSGGAGPQVEEMAAELMRMVGPEKIEEA